MPAAACRGERPGTIRPQAVDDEELATLGAMRGRKHHEVAADCLNSEFRPPNSGFALRDSGTLSHNLWVPISTRAEKSACLVELNCESDFVARHEEFQQLAHDIAMQICATDPRFICKEDVTEEALQREKEVLRSQAAATGKPENVLERIVEGKLGKFYEDNCLYEQHFIKDSGSALTVGELIASKIAKFGENIVIRRFSRLKIGETTGKPDAEPAPAATA